MTTSIANFYLDSTIALNNMAVSLLERRLYQAALESLHDSLQVLDGYHSLHADQHRRGTSCENTKDCLTPAEVEHRLYRASLHLSSEVESDHPPALAALDDDEPSLLEVGNTDFVGSQVMEIAVQNQFGQNMTETSENSSQQCIIYFQQTPGWRSMKETSLTLLGTILHNQGQACRCLSQQSRYSSPKLSEQLLDKSDQLFYLAECATQQIVSHDATESAPTAANPTTIPAELYYSKLDSHSQPNKDLRMTTPSSAMCRFNPAA